MKTSTHTYFPDLDALRFLAFFAIFCLHSFHATSSTILTNPIFEWIHAISQNGILGIEFFFTLSSFLVTYLMLQETTKNQRFNARYFLIRRSLRIWPLYFFMVFIGFVLLPLVAYFINVSITLPSLPYFLTFLANFYMETNGVNFLFLLTFLWSISVEEQFYIFWAGLLKGIEQRLHYLPFVCVLLLLTSIVFNYTYFYYRQPVPYFHTLRYLPNFAIGALLAFFSLNKGNLFQKWQHFPRWLIFTFYFIFLFIIYLNNQYTGEYWHLIDKILLATGFAFIVFEQSFCKHSFFKLRHWKTGTYLGKISYGLYCYHGVVLTFQLKIVAYLPFQETLLLVLFIIPIINFISTVIIAHVSFYHVEQRFLSLKSRFGV